MMTTAEAIYPLCAATSLIAAALLLRQYTAPDAAAPLELYRLLWAGD